MVDTISRLFLNTIKSYPKSNQLMFKKEGRYVALSSEEVLNQVKWTALGLKEIGLEPQQKLIVFAENGPWWTMTDFATLCAGGITVPIYTSLVPEQVKYIINDSDAKIVVCSNMELWQKIAAVKNDLPNVKHFIMIEPEAPEGVLTLAEVMDKGKRVEAGDPGLFERQVEAVRPDDLASIIYTSGTTGIPKGVMLTHANFVSNIISLRSIIEFTEKDTVLSFLPLSHVLERLTVFAWFYAGCTVAYAESIDTVAENLLEVRPTIMVSVPRLFDKIYAKVMDNVLASSSLKKKIFFWALGVGKKCGRKRIRHQPVSGLLRFQLGLAQKLVFSKIVEKTGGRIRFFVSGGAPLSGDIAEFFFALGIWVLEGYGLTETAPVLAVNTFENIRFGTVGKVIPGVEVKIADDNEILARGPNVMKGYYKKEKETQEVFEGGWFHTGDIGHFDEDGFLVITDRKKDLIVTAGGKNIAPQPIENLLKTNPYISNAVVVGGSRKFISAIVVPDFEKLEAYARLNNLPFGTRADLIKKDEILNFMLAEVNRSTPNLASYERVKKIILLDKDFEIEAGEITPTLKVKRNIIEQKYKPLIDELYEA